MTSSVTDEYVVVITDLERIGKIKGADVFHIKSVSVESITKRNMTHNQEKSEQVYLQKLVDHFESIKLYFSYDYDLTQSLQRQAIAGPGSRWKQVSIPQRTEMAQADSFHSLIMFGCRRMIGFFGIGTFAAK